MFKLGRCFSTSYKLLYFGSDLYSKHTLESLIKTPIIASIQKLDVLSPPNGNHDDPHREFNDYVTKQKLHRIPFFKKFGNELIPNIQGYDIGIIASFGKFIPSKVIDLFPKGMIVMHPSLLPAYRGACPLQYALLNNDTLTGITAQEISRVKFDAGNILAQEKYSIKPSDTYLSLCEELGKMSGTMLSQILSNFDDYKSKAVAQDENKVTYAPIIPKKECIFLWDKLTTAMAVKKFNALKGSSNESFSKILINNKWQYIKFLDLVKESTESIAYLSFLGPAEAHAFPGCIHWDLKKDKDMFIKCTDGWVRINEMKIESKGKISAKGLISTHFSNKNFKKEGRFLYRMACHDDVIKKVDKFEI